MKQHTGFHFKKQFGERLWRRYVHEHVIRSDEVTGNVIRYVLENPVRAGLVTDLRLYPFIGSSEYTLEQLLEFCVDPPESGRSSG
jgi:hypothetical protein